MLADDPPARDELSVALQSERVDQTYGDITQTLVKIFQRQRQLRPNGEVDEQTASALNELLREWGLLDEPESQEARLVTGGVRRQDGLLLQGVRVRAVHQARQGGIRLGEDTTDAEGRYTIRYERLPTVPSIDLRVSVINEDGQLVGSSQVVRNAKPLETIDVSVPVDAAPDDRQRIAGAIVLEQGRPAEGLQLRLYRRDFGGQAALLGEATTLAGGRYAFEFNQGGPTASLEVRAVKSDGQEIQLSKPLNRLHDESRVRLNLVAPNRLQPPDAEYRRLVADLTPHIGQMTRLATAKENAEQQDLTVLNRATGWDARLIALAAMTERLAADDQVNLPTESLYGLLRTGLPSEKLLLAQVDPEVAEQALKKARDAGIVEMTDAEVTRFKQDFQTFTNETRMAVRTPGSSSTYSELLNASGLSRETQDIFAPIFLRHRGSGAELWKKAHEAGLDDEPIRKLQLQGKFAFLAGNSEAMTTRLLNKDLNDPAELVGQDFHRAEKWASDVFDQAGIPQDRRANLTDADRKKLEVVIPAAYAGEQVESRLETYAEDMARKMRLSYPTHVLGRLLETDAKFKLPVAHDPTVTLLRSAAAQGFRFGETPVAGFLKSNAGVQGGLSDADFQAAAQQMRILQRVYQITPDHEAMPVLMSLNMTSAYDVMEYSETEFVALFEAKYQEIYKRPAPADRARLVRRRTNQVSSVTYNLFTIAKKLESEPPVAGLSAPVEMHESVKNELIKHFPTMEALFGSMDFCECEHCRSVLSPAAYLVDLLQFVDTDSGVWGNFLAHWKATHGNQDYPHQDNNGNAMKPYDVLIGRRPDLPHIPLTCENTHTALPYIDIVNEILEYYVAHGKLEEQAAHDTGDATTEELLAEPQNVIREAYDRLRDARYPLNLPFDLWIETVRQFCDYFETPLHRVLEAFRPNDDLFAPAQTFDRAAIFAESLRISPSETAILTNPDPLATWYELFGFTSDAAARTEAIDANTGQRIDLNSAKALARRLGVTYKEITEIVQTGFVNPELTKLSLLYKLEVSIADARFYEAHKALLPQDPATLSPDDQKTRLEVEAFAQKLTRFATVFNVPVAQLHTALQAIPFDRVLILTDPDAGCNFDLTTLQYSDGTKADPIAFLRINLFVRLWRNSVGVSRRRTALQSFVPRNTPFEAAHLAQQPVRTALIYLAHLKTLDERLKVGKHSRFKLLTLWSDMATTGKNPLYAQLFLTRSVLKSDPVFDHPLGQYLSAAGIAAVAQSRRHRVRLVNIAPADKIDPAAFAGEPKVELSYDESQRVQHLVFEGVLSDVEKAALAALSASPALPPLLDAVQRKAHEFSLIKGHVLSLQGALGLTADEIRRILEDGGKSLDAAELSLPNVSLLYRYGLLAKATQTDGARTDRAQTTFRPRPVQDAASQPAGDAGRGPSILTDVGICQGGRRGQGQWAEDRGLGLPAPPSLRRNRQVPARPRGQPGVSQVAFGGSPRDPRRARRTGRSRRAKRRGPAAETRLGSDRRSRRDVHGHDEWHGGVYLRAGGGGSRSAGYHEFCR